MLEAFCDWVFIAEPINAVVKVAMMATSSRILFQRNNRFPEILSGLVFPPKQPGRIVDAMTTGNKMQQLSIAQKPCRIQIISDFVLLLVFSSSEFEVPIVVAVTSSVNPWAKATSSFSSITIGRFTV